MQMICIDMLKIYKTYYSYNKISEKNASPQRVYNVFRKQEKMVISVGSLIMNMWGKNLPALPLIFPSQMKESLKTPTRVFRSTQKNFWRYQSSQRNINSKIWINTLLLNVKKRKLCYTVNVTKPQCI